MKVVIVMLVITVLDVNQEAVFIYRVIVDCILYFVIGVHMMAWLSLLPAQLEAMQITSVLMTALNVLKGLRVPTRLKLLRAVLQENTRTLVEKPAANRYRIYYIYLSL